MFVFGSLSIFGGIEGGVVGDMLAHFVGRLNQVVAQVMVAGFGQATLFGLEITGVGSRPPQVSDLGYGIFSVAQVTKAILLTLVVALGRLREALGATDLGPDAGSMIGQAEATSSLSMSRTAAGQMAGRLPRQIALGMTMGYRYSTG